VTRREVREPAPTCRTFFETSCTTKYVEQAPGKFAGDTTCEKIPIELCGTGGRLCRLFISFFLPPSDLSRPILLIFLKNHNLSQPPPVLFENIANAG
jgi:hypothetical protein